MNATEVFGVIDLAFHDRLVRKAWENGVKSLETEGNSWIGYLFICDRSEADVMLKIINESYDEIGFSSRTDSR